ncbi:MAG TPA: flippase activity-associated protein Agl23, partial [Nitrolancea sp.]|nr:flippase activity-associated protein Agl23 [Nitrolancea sp.]
MTSPISIAPDTSAARRERQVLSPPRTHVLPRQITLETLFYAVIFLLALVTRFWDLGSRALHHDESLHAYFSWIFAEGFGYRHDPLMHGPFLFHANALIYLLLGASDATSRIVPALAGVVVVMLPWLLRDERFLGRWGALTASALLLISPSILYYSRFLRHDIYCLLGTFALFIAIVRYVDEQQPKWAVLGGIAIGFLLCTKEVSFIVLFIFVAFLGAALIYRVAPILYAVVAVALVAFAVLAKALKALGAAPLPGIPWSNPTGPQIRTFTVHLLTHPLVVGALGITLLALVATLWLLDRRRDPERGWLDGLLGDAPDDSVAGALRELLWERRGLLWGIAFAVGIFVLFYSTLFTNREGLASGTFGAVGYWLGQQGVQRGEEPWFYYLLLLPQYEFVAVVLFPILGGWFAWTLLQARRAGAPAT